MQERAIITVVGKMMIVDITSLKLPFDEFSTQLSKLGSETIGVQIRCQKEAIFDAMHRI